MSQNPGQEPHIKRNPLSSFEAHVSSPADLRYLKEGDVSPNDSTDPIWLLGVQHPGVDDSSSNRVFNENLATGTAASPVFQPQARNYAEGSPPKIACSGAPWPSAFFVDFTSLIWLTYRSHIPPIRDIKLSDLQAGYDSDSSSSEGGSPKSKNWPWSREKEWSSDSGWGCMLRTAQSLLANVLIRVHLGRGWRRPPRPMPTVNYATYVQILTWFFDDPSPEAPFSIHRMALAGKEFGKDVGQWFGPSTAAEVIRKLVKNFPKADLGTSVAADASIYQNDVFSASHSEDGFIQVTAEDGPDDDTASWGDRPVLILVGIRLGIDGVNPTYHEALKRLFMLPQSAGIAGGKPSSSYYFVGSQADNLIYLDPHFTRSSIHLRPAPVPLSERSEQGSHTINEESAELIPKDGSEQFDPVKVHYTQAYGEADLNTFHCEKVRKLPLSGLDPSMLLGFLIRDADDWHEFKRKVADLPKHIFSIHDEPPAWPSDSEDNISLESLSDSESLA